VDHPAQHGVVWRRAAILVLLCIALALVAASDTLHAALLDLLAASKAVILEHPMRGALLFVLLAAASAMFAFVSMALIAPVAVFAWGEPLSMLLLWVGWILGGAAAYGVARLLGRAVVGWLTANAALRRLEKIAHRNAPFGLILLFQLALPSEIPGYVLGLVRYRFSLYLLALALGELPYAAATVYLGSSFVQAQSIVVLVVGLALAAVSVGAFYLLRKRITSPTGGEAQAPASRGRGRRAFGK
jgi:uncharacterized membrane protein YdjX (TVP38/TMEM64 family)